MIAYWHALLRFRPASVALPHIARQQWYRWGRWTAVCWIVVFWRLGYPSLRDPDEAHYAELTREMLHSRNWLVPLLDGQPYIDKPVLFHWIQGSSVALLGESEFAVRLPSAIAALGLFAITRRLGTALFGEEIGEWGAFLFATIPATFVLSSLAVFDMVFTTFLFGGVGCLIVGALERRRRIEIAGYALLTLAVMTKGPVALLLVVIFLLAAHTLGPDVRAHLRWLRWVRGLAVSLIVAAPWFVWMYFRFSERFVRRYLLAGNLWYFTNPRQFSTRVVSHTYYARVFVGGFFPAGLVVLGRGVDVIRGLRRGRSLSTAEKLLWLWILVVVGFFTAARFKLDHYIFPAAPACCLLAARAWHDAARVRTGTVGTRASIVATGMGLTGAGLVGGVYLFNIDLDLPPAAAVLPIALCAGGVGLLLQCRARHWLAPTTARIAVVVALASYTTIVMIGYPVLEQVHPVARVARQLIRHAAPDAPVAMYRLERWRASLRYYVARPVERLEAPEEVVAFLKQSGPVYVVMLRSEYESLRNAGVDLNLLIQERAVVGTSGRGIRRQRWGFLIVATNGRAPKPTIGPTARSAVAVSGAGGT